MALILLEPFQNVVNTGVAQLTTQRIWPNTLEYISLVLGGTFTKAEITQLVVKLGQKPIWTLGGGADNGGSTLQSLNLYEGRVATSTELMLPFANPFARSPKQQYIGAVDTGQVGINNITLLVTIASATNPTLTAWAQVAPPKTLSAANNLLFRALLQTPIAPAAAGNYVPFLLNVGQAGGALLRRLIFPSAYVSAFEVKRDGLDIYEQVPLAVMNAIESELFPHTPQSNFPVLDFIEDDIESKALTSVRQVTVNGQPTISLIPQQYLLSHSQATAYTVYADVFANLNGL
jgi:hypothetical protein